MSELKNQIEAILFASGKIVSYEELARLCNTDMAAVKAGLSELKSDYQQRDSPLILSEESEGWKMTVREKYLSFVNKMLPETELSKSVLETLAVIAWKQPVLQSEIIKIRTNKAYEHIDELVERGFISKEKSGRSYLIKVTNKFREYFELPDKEAIKKIFEDIQEHIMNEESAESGEEHLGKLEVYEEKEEVQEKPHIKFYDRKEKPALSEKEIAPIGMPAESAKKEEAKVPEEIERNAHEIEKAKEELSKQRLPEEKEKPAEEAEAEGENSDKEAGAEEKKKEKDAETESDEEPEERKLSPELEELAGDKDEGEE